MTSRQTPLDPAGNHAGNHNHAAQPWLGAAAKVFVFGALGLLLYFGHTAFVPVALALLFGLILSGPVEMLHRRRVPRGLSALLILTLALAAITGIVALMWNPAQDWYAKAPQTMASIRHKVVPVAQFMNRLDQLRRTASSFATQRANALSAATASPPPEASTESLPALILGATAPAAASGLCFVIVTLFLLAGGPPMLARMTAAFVDNLKSSRVLYLIEKVRAEVGHFYVTTTLINVGLGIATGVAMWLWGMPTPYLWGALAAVFNYIPYAGPVTTLVVTTLVAMVSFDTVGRVLGVAGTYVVFAVIEGQIAQPMLVGRRMEVNPLLIFLGLWFGAMFWGIAGVLLATPVLVTLKVVAENARGGKPMREFLGPNDQTPDRDARLRKFARRPLAKI